MKKESDKKAQQKTKSPIAEMEESVLAWWEKKNILAKTLAARKKGPPFVFYEGPPTANGSPHPGHVMGRCFKDLFLRYKTMQGYSVPRRAGWDTHGLPVEIEVEKQMGFRSKADIEKFGVAAFNSACRASVWKYKDEWERMTRRIGFWLDLEHPYVTYENDYIESLWWVVSRLHEQGLLEEDYKVTPFCTRCGTGLSSHEIAQGYKTVADPAVYVKFRVRREKDGQQVFEQKSKSGRVFDDHLALDAPEYFLVWTTTPWTLPANAALAVNPKLEYVRARAGNEVFVLAKSRLALLGEGVAVLETLKGSELAGRQYEQLVPYLKPDKPAFAVVAADFVSAEDGSGIVHLAPAYGEDDMAAAKEHGLPVLHPVREDGTFSKELPWQGMFVKKADPAITEELKQRGLLFKEEKYEHEYPFCWRCDTPLLYFARKSWFVRMAKLKNKLQAGNANITWIPEHIKEGRFGEWLREVKDWAFSRERYWGTPLPLWRCEQCAETRAVGSLAELGSLSALRNRYFIMRHGEALFNVKNLCDSSGNQTNHLTKKGEEQVKESLAKFVKKNPNTRIDVIVSSPLIRAQETAKLAGETFAVAKSAIHTDPLLQEIKGGIFDGKKVSDYHKYFTSLEEKLTKTPPGGENLHDVKKRLAQFMRETDSRYENKTILIISHEYPLWTLDSMLKGCDDKESVAAKKERGSDYIKTAEMRELPTAKLPLDEDGNLDLHKPYIDAITFPCASCGGTMKRTPEVCDVWFDSGAMPLAQNHFPFAQTKKESADPKELVKHIPYPADFICEGVDQTRGWFYTLLAVATALGFERPYRNVISFGHILDKEGKKMSKSKKNYADPLELADRVGIDALRWYFFTVNPPGEPKRFDEKDVVDAQRKSVMVLLNIRQFLDSYGALRKGPVKLPPLSGALDRWVVSRLHETAIKTSAALERYDSLAAARGVAAFLDDLTNWYVRRSRERFQAGIEKEKRAAATVLSYVYETTLKLAAPFIPFVTEHLWQDLHKGKSVHLERYPQADEKRIDKDLQYDMMKARDIVSIALKQRAEAGVKVRQPLGTLKVKQRLGAELAALVCDEVNVKELAADPAFPEEARLDVALTPALIEEGMAREAIRHIQQARKEAGLQASARIALSWAAEGTAAAMAERWMERIAARVGAKKTSRAAYGTLVNTREIVFEGGRFSFVINKHGNAFYHRHRHQTTAQGGAR